MPRLKLTVEYDGTRYVGWQTQRNGPSIEQRLSSALEKLVGHEVKLAAAGRTDSGVHALGQVVAFSTPQELPLKAYWMGLNGLLPEDIAVVTAEEMPADFDPRRWSQGKLYRYLISNRNTRSPLRRHTHWEIFAPLDVSTMARESQSLIGRHDFSAFRAGDCQASHPIREIRRLTVIGDRRGDITIEVEGTAFLKHMVRNVVGTLVEVGKGKTVPGWVSKVLASKDRAQAGMTAPAHGLILVQVFYGQAPTHLVAPEDEEG